jgi:hypothetical protein
MGDECEPGASRAIGLANQKFGIPGLFRRVGAETHPIHDLFDEVRVTGVVGLRQDDRVGRPADILHEDFDYSSQESIPPLSLRGFRLRPGPPRGLRSRRQVDSAARLASRHPVEP